MTTTPELERVAAAKAALDAAKTEYDEACDALVRLAHATGASQFKSDRITVSLCNRRMLNAHDFTAWVQANRPDEIEPTVRASYRRAFLDGLRRDGDDWIAPTGEVIDFADETEYLSVRAR